MTRTTLTALLFVALLAPLAQAETFAERWDRRVREFRAENPRLRADQDVVLFGSSSTEGWKYSRRIERFLPTIGKRSVNRGISGDGIGLGSRGLLNRVDVSVLQAKPKFVFVLNGRNSIGQHDGVARSAATYERVVKQIQAGDSKPVVVIVSCAPVRGRYAHLKTKITQFNALLKQVAQRTGARFIDLHPRLTDADGLMKSALTSDGLHFKDEGYRILGRLMEETVAAVEAANTGSATGAGSSAKPAVETNPGPESDGSGSSLDEALREAKRSVQRFLEDGERLLASGTLSLKDQWRLRGELWSRRVNPNRCFQHETVEAFLAYTPRAVGGAATSLGGRFGD